MTRAHKPALFLAGLAISLPLVLASCLPSQGLTAGSSCNDFLHASSEVRDQAIKDIALKLHVSGAGNPLMRPNVEYLCGQTPDMTLGRAIQRSEL